MRDRLLLGLVAGLGGNVIKLTIDKALKKKNWAEIDGPERAAGMLVPPHTLAKTKGKLVGHAADSLISCMLGVSTVYLLSMTGKNNAILKGAATGQVFWTTLYGILGTMGASKVDPVDSKTVLSELASHTAFGATSAYFATRLGDEGLFNGEIPFSATPINHISQSETANHSQVIGDNTEVERY